MNNVEKRYGGLVLYLTLNCNLNCTYCFCGKKYKEDMTIETAEAAIAMFDKLSHDHSNITFFGGEPLLKMDLIKKIITLNNTKYHNKFGFSITTNGTLLTNDVYYYLRENNVNVLLSLDGGKKSHDLNRRFYDGNGSWDSIINNVHDFIEDLPVRMTFSRETLSDLFDNISYLYEMGFTNIAFYPAGGDSWTDDDICIFEEEMKKIIDYIYVRYCEGKTTNSHWIDKSIIRHITGKIDSCKPGMNQFSVTPNGDIYPCNHTNFSMDALKLGTIKTGIDEDKVVWLKTQMEKTDAECEECSLKNRCNYCYIGMCEETGFLWKIPDWFCAMNQCVIINSDSLASKLYSEQNPLFMRKFYMS